MMLQIVYGWMITRLYSDIFVSNRNHLEELSWTFCLKTRKFQNEMLDKRSRLNITRRPDLCYAQNDVLSSFFGVDFRFFNECLSYRIQSSDPIFWSNLLIRSSDPIFWSDLLIRSSDLFIKTNIVSNLHKTRCGQRGLKNLTSVWMFWECLAYFHSILPIPKQTEHMDGFQSFQILLK